MDASTVLSFTAAVVAVLGAGFATWRQRSGRIGTSEARDLWSAAEAIRKELRAEIDVLKKEHEQCQADLATQRLANRALEDRVKHLEGAAGD